MDLQLVSPIPDSGFAYNQGVYWPLGLLTIASRLKRAIPEVQVEILDEARPNGSACPGREGGDGSLANVDEAAFDQDISRLGESRDCAERGAKQGQKKGAHVSALQM